MAMACAERRRLAGASLKDGSVTETMTAETTPMKTANSAVSIQSGTKSKDQSIFACNYVKS